MSLDTCTVLYCISLPPRCSLLCLLQLLKTLAATRPVVIFDNMRTGGSTDSSNAKLSIPIMADSVAALIHKLKLDRPDIWR